MASILTRATVLLLFERRHARYDASVCRTCCYHARLCESRREKGGLLSNIIIYYHGLVVCLRARRNHGHDMFKCSQPVY